MVFFKSHALNRKLELSLLALANFLERLMRVDLEKSLVKPFKNIEFHLKSSPRKH
jgi:hypothetical protein